MQNSALAEQAVSFLESLFSSTGLRLQVRLKHGVTGEVLDIYGPDEELLQAQTGELLDALQHIVNQVFSRSLAGTGRLICDVHGFRASREAELQAMANLAAKQVRESGRPFTFEPMTANERRVIHLTLANSDDLQTESIGEGSGRKLRVSRK